MKGADVVMAGIVQYNDWLEEEVLFFLTSCNKFIKKIISNHQSFKKFWHLNALCVLVWKHGKGRTEGPGGL